MIDIILAIALLLGRGPVGQGSSEPMGPVPAPQPPAD